MARTAAIIVGGGIAAGAPFTLGALTKISSVTPPAINASIAVERTQAALEVITIRNNAFPAQGETLQVLGGLISDTTGSTAALPHDNVVIGRNAVAPALTNTDDVVIGTGTKAPSGAGATFNVIIGAGVDVSGIASIGSSVIIGATNVWGALFPAATTIVGAGNTWNNAFAGPGIGTGSSWQGAGVGIGNQQSLSAVNNWIAIGRSVHVDANSQTVIGDNARGIAGDAFAVVLGRNTLSFGANSFVVGATGGAQISTVLIGAGDAQVGGQAVLHRHTNASGADNPAANIQIQAGLGTGNAATLGRIQFLTGAPAGSGAGVQAATVQFEILPSAGGAAAPAVSFPNYTTGAAANLGTLANAPSAGNPTEWIPILAKGNVRYIPAWT